MSIEFMSTLVEQHARFWWAVTNGFVSGWLSSFVLNSLWFPVRRFFYFLFLYLFYTVLLIGLYGCCMDVQITCVFVQMSGSVIAESDKSILLS